MDNPLRERNYEKNKYEENPEQKREYEKKNKYDKNPEQKKKIAKRCIKRTKNV